MDVTNVNNNFYSDALFPDDVKAPTPKAKSKPDQLDVYKENVKEDGKEDGKIARVLSQKEMQNLVNDLNDKMSKISSDLRFGFNDTVDMMEVTVVNLQTDKVIRRFPTEDAVKLMSSMKEFLGLLFDEKG